MSNRQAAAELREIANSIRQGQGPVIATLAVGGPGGPGIDARAYGGGTGYKSIAISGGGDVAGSLKNLATELAGSEPSPHKVRRLRGKVEPILQSVASAELVRFLNSF